MVHPEDLAVTEAAARAAINEGGDSWEHEYRYRRSDGSWACMLERAGSSAPPTGLPSAS